MYSKKVAQVISINRNCSVLEIKKKYKKDKYFSIPPDLNEQDLIEIIRLHQNQIYSSNLFEIIAIHPAATEMVHGLLIELGDMKNDSIANSIATSGKASEKILLRLLDHESQFVKEHVRLALFNLQMQKASGNDFEKMLDNCKSENIL